MFKTLASLLLAAALGACASPAPDNASAGSSVGESDTQAGRIMRAECRGLKGPSYDACMRRGAVLW